MSNITTVQEEKKALNNELPRSKLRGIKQECHARENGHPSWIPSFEGLTNSKQASGNLPGLIKA
jgi:hypothetical protein